MLWQSNATILNDLSFEVSYWIALKKILLASVLEAQSNVTGQKELLLQCNPCISHQRRYCKTSN